VDSHDSESVYQIQSFLSSFIFIQCVAKFSSDEESTMKGWPNGLLHEDYFPTSADNWSLLISSWVLPNVAGASWSYEVFISHAGSVKNFARVVAGDLTTLGFRPFVDTDMLNPGDSADTKIVKAAEISPIGLVLLNEDFLKREWPVRELKFIVDANTLLPVLVGMSYNEVKATLEGSALIRTDLGKSFVEKVLRTTFGTKESLDQDALRQRVCLDVTRLFVEKGCPKLPDKLVSAKHYNRARMLRGESSFGHLTKTDCKEIDGWIAWLCLRLGN
jgi:hypothetical protein